jgi:hypothetical protein
VHEGQNPRNRIKRLLAEILAGLRASCFISTSNSG